MKYYALEFETLAQYGLGNEPWRKKKLGKALVSEAEIINSFGYPSGAAFEQATQTRSMNLNEAQHWARNL